MAVITLVAIFAVVILRQTAAQQVKDEQTAQAVMAYELEQEQQKAAKTQPEARAVSSFALPQEMKGAQIEAGKEFLTELSAAISQAEQQLGESSPLQEATSSQEISRQKVDKTAALEEIDRMMEQAQELGLNALFVRLNNAYGTLWQSSSSMTSFDLLEQLSQRAHQADLQLYGIYDLSLLARGERMQYLSCVDAAALDAASEQLTELTSQALLDGLLLDGHQNPQTEYSYYQMTLSGENKSLDDYLTGQTQALVQNAVDTVRSVDAGLPIGLAVDSVWATAEETADGMPLACSTTSLGTYHADTLGMVEQGLCDFVLVKNYNALDSQTVPFAEVADWWNTALEPLQTTAYMGQASSLGATWQDGWGSSRELADQWQSLQEQETFSGTVLNSLDAMINDSNYTAYHLTQLWEGASSQDTATAQAEEQAVGSYHEVEDQYAGALLSKVKPAGSYSVADGDTIQISAVAPKGADLTVSFHGEVFPMRETKKSTGMAGYSRYVAEYDVDEASVTRAEMGTITVIASYNGQRDTMDGASVTFKSDRQSSGSQSSGSQSSGSQSSSNQTSNSNNQQVTYGSSDSGVIPYTQPKLSTSASKKIGSGTLVQVVKEQALTFPVNKNTIYPDTKCYPMPYGTMDYVTGDRVGVKDGSSYRCYYKLASGRRVYCDDVQAVSSGISIKGNRITNMTVKANSQFTYVILQSDYPVSYLPDYSTGKMKFEFQNTVSTPGDLSLTKNPIFSDAEWNGSTLTLEFLDNNAFLGYKGYHENGNIVLRFNNPTGIKGARIVVDPGHGGSDPGVADGIDSNWPEKRVNWAMAQQIAQSLRSKGASVKLLETYNNTTSLDSRLVQAKNFDTSLFLCIHSNSSETNAAASGSECYYFYPFSKNLAARMSSATAKGLSAKDRGAKYDVFYVNRDPQFVSILSEVGFLTNSSDYGKMKKESYQQKVGDSVADAVAAYLEKTVTQYTGRTGTQSTGQPLSASNGPTLTGDNSGSSQSSSSEASSSQQGSSTSSNKQESSSASTRPSGPVSQTVVSGSASPKGDGKVKYIIFTDPENKKLKLKVGDEKKLGIRINGDSSVQRKYTTSDKYVATIDKNGVVTAVGAGSCKITVVAGNQGGTIDVTVTGGSSASGSALTSGSSTTSGGSTTSGSSTAPDIGNGRPGIDGAATTAPDIGNGRPGLDSNRNAGLESSSGYVPTTSIRIRATRDYVSAGNSIQLEVVFSPSNATGQPVNWSISRGAIYGEVDNRGVFTGIEQGYSTVKVTTADGAYSATYRIEIV